MLDEIYLTFLKSTLDVAGEDLGNRLLSRLLIAQEMDHLGEWLNSIDEQVDRNLVTRSHFKDDLKHSWEE